MKTFKSMILGLVPLEIWALFQKVISFLRYLPRGLLYLALMPGAAIYTLISSNIWHFLPKNPYNFPRNNAVDLSRVFLESPNHSSFRNGLTEVLHCILNGHWGPSMSIPPFLISNLFWENLYNFARNGATDLNRVFFGKFGPWLIPSGTFGGSPLSPWSLLWAIKVNKAFSHP